MSAAAVIAFWLAFDMQLPTPYSAVTTVFIVANPVRGAIVSKSAWRLGGTVIGAMAAVIQFACFAQSPILFDLFMAVWVGICCAGSTLLRFFASYGTVLAGYTVVIVDVGGLADPGGALLTALYRISVVALGIVVTGLVFLLTQRAPTPAALAEQVGARMVALLELIRAVLAGEPFGRIRVRRRDIGVAIAGLEQAIILAGADSLEIGRRSRSLRLALTRLLGSLTSGVHAAELIAAAAAPTAPGSAPPGPAAAGHATPEHATPGPAALKPVASGTIAAGPVSTGPAPTDPVAIGSAATDNIATDSSATGPVTTGPAPTDPVAIGPAATDPTATDPTAADPVATETGAAATDAAAVLDRALAAVVASLRRSDLAAARAALAGADRALARLMDDDASLDLLAALDQARDTVNRLVLALDDLDRSRTGAPAPPGERLRPYLDWRSALRNGLRGFLTVAIAAVFWYATEWPAGPTLLVYLVPAVALLSNLPAPSSAASRFALGTVGAVVGATILQPVVLPAIDGFPLAVGAVLLFAAPGIVFQINPRWTLVAFSYLVFLNSAVALQNPMRFDLATLLDNDEAYILGCAALLLVFRVLIPPRATIVVGDVAVSVARAARAVARDPTGGGIGWENVQNQKLAQISDRLALIGSPRRALVVEDAAAGVMVGRLARRHANRARRADSSPALLAASDRARAVVVDVARDPAAAAAALGRAAASLLDDPASPAGPDAAARRDIAAMLHESGRLIARHGSFFARRPVIE